MNPNETHDSGMKVRREVLGDEYVDAAVEKTTPFTADFQDFITRYAWGEVWTRPGLDRKTRSVTTRSGTIPGFPYCENVSGGCPPDRPDPKIVGPQCLVSELSVVQGG